ERVAADGAGRGVAGTKHERTRRLAKGVAHTIASGEQRCAARRWCAIDLEQRAATRLDRQPADTKARARDDGRDAGEFGRCRLYHQRNHPIILLADGERFLGRYARSSGAVGVCETVENRTLAACAGAVEWPLEENEVAGEGHRTAIGRQRRVGAWTRSKRE